MIVKVIFWCLAGIVVYAYAGYPLLLLLICLIKHFVKLFQKSNLKEEYEPEITIFITAYNEIDCVEDKIKNTQELDYPKNKITQLWITDGSDDGTPEKVSTYKDVNLYHDPIRKGKVAAMNRGMQYINTPIVVFSDTNTMLAKDVVKKIVKLFVNPDVGCVAGEKRIVMKDKDAAISSGEGLYWKYESFIKKCESEIHTVVGAAGELFAIRASLFEPVKEDTLLDDFVISLKIAKKGYKIKYDPNAYAIEKASISIKEEMKRKVRIASGGIQAMIRMPELLNFFKYKFLSFQYFSHKILRWTLVPFSFPFILILNIILVYNSYFLFTIYSVLFILQALFYLLALTGLLIEEKQMRLKVLFFPYYLLFMNISVILGIFRYLSGKQSVNWDRAKRGN